VVPYSNFFPYVLPYVMGCPQPLALQAVRDTCIDFAEQTLVISRTLDPIKTSAELDTYDLDAGIGATVQVVTQAWYDHDRLEVISADSPKARVEMYNAYFPAANTTPAHPTALIENDDHTVTLNCRPSDHGTLVLRAALKPTRSSTSCDDVLFNDYAVTIGKGAVAYLMKIPNEPFSNPTLAASFDLPYIFATTQARIRANKGLGRANLQVQMRKP